MLMKVSQDAENDILSIDFPKNWKGLNPQSSTLPYVWFYLCTNENDMKF